MTKTLKAFLKFAAFPIGMFALLGIFLIIWQSLGLPGLQEIIAFAEEKYAVHGYWVMFVTALAEGMLLINWYFPGSVVLMTGIVFAMQGPKSVVAIVFITSLGLILMMFVNFWIGKYGWYKLFLKFGLKGELERMQKRLEKHGWKILLISYFHPHTGSLTATAAGILQMKTKTFALYGLSAYAFWTSLWIVVIYIVGPKFINIVNFQSLLILVGLWIVGMGVQFTLKQRRRKVLVTEEVENPAKIMP